MTIIEQFLMILVAHRATLFFYGGESYFQACFTKDGASFFLHFLVFLPAAQLVLCSLQEQLICCLRILVHSSLDYSAQHTIACMSKTPVWRSRSYTEVNDHQSKFRKLDWEAL